MAHKMKHEPWNPNACPVCSPVRCEVARRRELKAAGKKRQKKSQKKPTAAQRIAILNQMIASEHRQGRRPLPVNAKPMSSRSDIAAAKYIEWVLDEVNDRGRLDDDTWEEIAKRIAGDLNGKVFT
jgi:hypothetical protein